MDETCRPVVTRVPGEPVTLDVYRNGSDTPERFQLLPRQCFQLCRDLLGGAADMLDEMRRG